jgi:hypothetical protein
MGYCTPPNHTKFKPGQSGNPLGRPKNLNESDMATMIHKIMLLYAAAKTGNISARDKIQQLKNILATNL